VDFFGVLEMRVLITLVFLVTLFCSAVQAQQSNQAFQINDPLNGEAQIPVELLYFDETEENRQAQVAPATTVRSPHLDQRTQPPGSSMPMLNAGQLPPQSPTQSPNRLSPVKKTSVPGKKRFIGPLSFTKDPALRTTVQSYDGVEVKNHFFFGIDRESCCDEWAGLCGCGGLKANPGHWGQPWIRGCDACEEKCCPGKHSHRRKHHRQKYRSCDGSCGSACGD
jgi:hypothetical protein